MLTHEPLLPDPIPVDVGGTCVATRVVEPAGPVRGDVVLCHGTPWSSQVWGRVARELGRDHRVFLWDMPGYGDSEKGPAVATDLRSQMERMASLLRTWDLHHPHVVAHDIGGAVALGAHLLHGVDYADLFLWDVVTLDPWGSPFFRLVAENTDVFAQLPPDLHAALVTGYITGALSRKLPDRDIDALVSPWTAPGGQAAFYLQITALSSADTRAVAERLGATRCPTRIGWGRADPWIPLDQAYELRSGLPGDPDVVVLDDVGHLTPYENPVAVAAALRAWLTGAADRPRAGRVRRPGATSADATAIDVCARRGSHP
ncbi:alpha/beta fold hydrolase [Pseudonocardia sp. ICBG1034]|uniref:alpha/beta fold hydrolase n=1 Tax=Pseudonocardia sp. ICBG1034 TaxID=2844381 RepID=UPI001CCA1AB9|nr:alpha/beta hydrolase [Pseudonocardia sp. ICBG1034]